MSPHLGADGLVQVTCRPVHLNFLTVFTSLACYIGRTPLLPPITACCWAGRGEGCRPRNTWRPPTLVGSPVFSSAQDVNSPSSPACATLPQGRTHTRRFEDPHGSARRLLTARLWGPHLLATVRTVSNYAELRSFRLNMCIDAPECTTSSLSSGFIADGGGRHHTSESEKKVALSFSLSLKMFLASLHASPRAHRSCLRVSS